MKKLVIYFTLLFSVVLLWQCKSSKEVSYNIYAGLQPQDSMFIVNTAEAGKVLYKEYCSNCHGIFGKGKSDIANFSKEDLDNYQSAFIANDTKNHSVATDITREELDHIMIFLQFYKRK